MGRGFHTSARRAGATASALLVVPALLIVSALTQAGAATRAAGAVPAFLRGAGVPAKTAQLPASVRFREVPGRGLLVKAWVNNSGPYDFAVDTGAGATIISRRVAAEARVAISTGSPVSLSGLSGRRGAEAREATVRSFAAGDERNSLPARGLFIVADSLPEDLDGVLDPTECFHPLGYFINFTTETLRAFDPRQSPLRRSDETPGGATVAWLTEQGSRRPFVMLGGGRRALVDTGSGFGLAVTEQSARSLGIATASGGREREGVRDLGRGRVGARRIGPATVHVGPLVLRGVPTDLLAGAAPDAPVLLGRDALRPFELTFDPVNRLIRFAPR